MVFPKIEDAFMKFNIEITFKPERDNGLIFYNGQRRGSGDYIALSLNGGYPEFRYDFGNNATVLKANRRISKGQWHTIKINRIRKDGFMIIDNQDTVPMPSSARVPGLELIENLYLGGVPKFEDIVPTAVAVKEGFVGCISRLILSGREVELNQEVIFSEGTTSCEPCADDPCSNDGICLEANSETGYTCVCQKGFIGKNCTIVGEGCTPTTCNTGKCLESETGVQCFCPINKTGDRCQYIEHLDEDSLSFRDGSFAAYIPAKTSKLNIQLKIRPENLNDSVILYIAESDTANGDFAALILKNRHLEFKFMTGARLLPVIIRSRNPINANKWTDVTIGRRLDDGFLQINNEPEVTGKLVGSIRPLYLKTHLYIGGYDKFKHLNSAVDVKRGFDGCISGVSLFYFY